MSSDLRNPYVILRIPFGASRDTATRAFARLSKGLRRDPDASDILTELTWSLNQVQEALRDPRAALHIYRVPADEAAFVPSGVGTLRPRPEPMARATGESTKDLEAVLDDVRREAVCAAVADVASSADLPPR